MCPYCQLHMSLCSLACVLDVKCICPDSVTRCSFRDWPKHSQQYDSSTSDTNDDEYLGGMGYYSHGPHNLTHNHWVEQVIAAGSFSVHCTESAEAHHKISMKLTANRVRHLRQNQTQESMLSYLLRHVLFTTLLQEQSSATPAPLKKCLPPGGIIRLPLLAYSGPRVRTYTWLTNVRKTSWGHVHECMRMHVKMHEDECQNAWGRM